MNIVISVYRTKRGLGRSLRGNVLLSSYISSVLLSTDMSEGLPFTRRESRSPQAPKAVL